MTVITGRTALITGGASGIGLLMGEILLSKGLKRLIVWDMSEQNIASAAKRLGPRAEFHRIDVTDTAAVVAMAARNEEAGPPVDILINNAGIVVGRHFAEHSHADIDRTMQVNTTAIMHLTLTLLPGLVRRGSGHVVNIASAAGLVSNPGMSVYCASKWAVIGWSDSLRLEMEAKKNGVRVTTVLPYYIDTGMFDGVKSPVIPILQAEPTARKIVRAIERNRIFLRMPAIVNILPLVRGILPARMFDVIVGRFFGIYESMSEFKGRST
ncbi:SDR family oxidoreductase [Pseudohoeflea coraliihabitans]|uniref:SDR family oxidoreductase n=1 Tax=Pseudohoeflea coraliihabitans TaxID=2860393 RepID=A0ABS6WR89_9HYPH|nr:SDR family oxidoreductase [Pseudohoeflea sp. DP4N28-3]MBW3097559.1 SDR family oxidoreductase [Pseudohoeflea sp. DP4N28-3]